MSKLLGIHDYDPVELAEVAHPAQPTLPPLPLRTIGQPRTKKLVSWLDIGSLILVLGGFVVAVTVVWSSPVAVRLGQTNQLVFVGFALAVMGLCAQRQMVHASLFLEVQAGESTLQNIDALLRNQPFAWRLGIIPRITLLALLALPVGLSVAYKRFSGGHSAVPWMASDSDWGFVTSPGQPWTGNGLSLAASGYVPFWQNPSINRTYGYNLYVASNTTSAALDTPFPDMIQDLQAQLRLGDYMIMNATVNATVSENINLKPSQQNNSDFWDRHYPDSQWEYTDIDMFFGFHSAMLWRDFNSSELLLSIWNVSDGEDFYSTAQRYVQTRRLCFGVWNITSSNMTLIDANILQADGQPVERDQRIVQNASLTIGSLYTVLLPEYNYRWYPRLGAENLNTFPPLVASIVWSRMIVRWGAQSASERAIINQTVDPQIAAHLKYVKPAKDVNMFYETITLKRSPLLLFVFAINPVLVIVAVTARVLLYSTPIDEGFGLVSLLSGAKKDSLDLLHGAALSGSLTRGIRVRFDVNPGENNQLEHIQIGLDEQGPSASLKSGRVYG